MFVFFIVFSVIGNIVWLLRPIVIGKIFNEIQFSEQSQLNYIAYGLLSLILLTIVGWLFHGISRFYENKNAFLVKKDFRQDMFEKVMDLPISWHKNHHSGDTIDKINKASDRLYDFSSGFHTIIPNIVGLITSIIVLAFYDIKPVFIALFVSIVAIVVIIKFDKKLLKHYKTIFKAENFISSGIYDYISNFITIISLRLKRQALDELEWRSTQHFETFKQASKINEWKWFISSFLIALMTAGVLFLHAYSSYQAQGVIVIGTLFILYQYLDRIGGAFYAFAAKYGDITLQNAAVVAAEVISNEYANLNLDKKPSLSKMWKVIQIMKMNFSYKIFNEDKIEEKIAVKDVSLKIEKREKIAFIGMSGSGKSTALSLLRGLHEADSVAVYCDGKKIESGLDFIYDSCTFIPQEPEIFNNTIEYNITLGVHVEKKLLEEVIELARLTDLINRLDKGLKTNVQEKGVSLSGGEKQRLALARGFLAAQESEMVFLDEPTSSVDVGNEFKIYQNIFEKFKDKVIISSIHGLHLLRYFDYIYMFKDGQIVAQGSFSVILEDDNFKALWENYNMEHKDTRIIN